MATASTAGRRDTDPLGELFGRHFAFVWRSLRHLGVSAADAEDLAQEVFIVAHRNIDQVDEPARAWLFAVARRVAANERRRLRRAARRDEALSRVGPVRAPDLEAVADRQLALEAVLRELPEDQRLVLLLRDLEGFKTREVAEALELSVNTVFSRLRLARARLERFALQTQQEQGGR